MTHDGSGDEPPEEFAHLFRPDPVGRPDRDEDVSSEHVDDASDPFDAWEPLVAVPQATPQGGIRSEDPPLPASSLNAAHDDGVDDGDVVADAVDDAAVDEVVVEVIDEAVEDAPAHPPAASIPADPKEGRLFRSRGAPERDDAIPAVGSMQARRLRTLARGDESVVEGDVHPSPPPMPRSVSGEPAPALQVMAAPARERQRAAEPRERERRDERTGSLTALGVYAVTIGVTVILAFGETLFFGGEPGIITGIGLLVVSVFAAFTVRTYDGIHAIFAPSIAFLVASLTAGQVGITATGLTGRAVVVFFLLGNNWMWILGSTAAALVIVALRRRLR